MFVSVFELLSFSLLWHKVPPSRSEAAASISLFFSSRNRSAQISGSQAILDAVDDAKVVIEVGRSSSFEITINDKLVYSKLAAGTFPSFPEIVAQVEQAADGK